jgi:hypothetical protein
MVGSHPEQWPLRRHERDATVVEVPVVPAQEVVGPGERRGDFVGQRDERCLDVLVGVGEVGECRQQHRDIGAWRFGPDEERHEVGTRWGRDSESVRTPGGVGCQLDVGRSWPRRIDQVIGVQPHRVVVARC